MTWGDKQARKRYAARKQYRAARKAANRDTREGRRALYLARKAMTATHEEAHR